MFLKGVLGHFSILNILNSILIGPLGPYTDYGIGYRMPLIIRILSRLKIITLKGFSLNRAYTNIGNPEAKTNKVKPLTYITFLYNIPKVVLKLGNLIEGTSDLRGVGHSNNSNGGRDNNKGDRA